MGSVNSAVMMVTLVDSSKRRRNIWQVVDWVREEAVRSVPGIRRLAIKEMGADVMASSAAPIQVIFFGPELERLSEMGEQARRLAEEIPAYRDDILGADPAQLHVVVDLKAQGGPLGGSGSGVLRAQGRPHERSSTGSTTAPVHRADQVFPDDQRQDRRPRASQDRGQAARWWPQLRCASGGRQGPTLIEHDNFRRVVSVLGWYQQGGPPALSSGLVCGGARKIVPPAGRRAGGHDQMEESFQRLLRGLYLGDLHVPLLLVAQFRSLIEPFNMVFSLSLILTGILGELLLAHQSFSTVSILAVVILTGMMMTVVVLMIDLVLRLRAEGMERNEAILAAGPIRLRPILMTSFISIVVLIPVAFFPRTGIDAYAPQRRRTAG
jgi:HAE1 family hydrophobic/amphiphilic exporter-1